MKTIIFLILLAAGIYYGYTYFQNQTKTIATDPSFPEVKRGFIDGFPTDFPVYPGAILKGSSKTNPENQPDTGYRAKWVTHDSVVNIMKWYEQELPKNGWTYEPPDDTESIGEQVAIITKGDLKGYVAAEIEGDEIEIVVDLRKQ